MLPRNARRGVEGERRTAGTTPNTPAFRHVRRLLRAVPAVRNPRHIRLWVTCASPSPYNLTLAAYVADHGSVHVNDKTCVLVAFTFGIAITALVRHAGRAAWGSLFDVHACTVPAVAGGKQGVSPRAVRVQAKMREIALWATAARCVRLASHALTPAVPPDWCRFKREG